MKTQKYTKPELNWSHILDSEESCFILKKKKNNLRGILDQTTLSPISFG